MLWDAGAVGCGCWGCWWGQQKMPHRLEQGITFVYGFVPHITRHVTARTTSPRHEHLPSSATHCPNNAELYGKPSHVLVFPPLPPRDTQQTLVSSPLSQQFSCNLLYPP